MAGIPRAAWLLTLVLAVVWTLPARTIHASGGVRQGAAIEAVLEAAGRYLEDYIGRITAVVSEEDYRQTVLGPSTLSRMPGPRLGRSLVSDVAIIAAPHWSAGWLSFRDVQSVDGEAVRDRAERISGLFASTAVGDPLAQADRITAESSRYNLSGFGLQIERTINYPMMALRYLRAEHQSRSRFELAEMARIDDERVAVVSFAEEASPRLIASFDASPAHGRFWIEPSTGRVVRSELRFETTNERDTARIEARIEVRFREAPRIGLWLPQLMIEDYRAYTRSGSIRITGRAEYSNFRKFDVDVSTIIRDSSLPSGI